MIFAGAELGFLDFTFEPNFQLGAKVLRGAAASYGCELEAPVVAFDSPAQAADDYSRASRDLLSAVHYGTVFDWLFPH